MSGDLNHDGRVDLVTTMPQADAVAVFLATAAGGFAPAVTYPAGDGALEGVLADLNGDGHLDLALEGLSEAFVLFGNGTGGFAAPTTVSIGSAVVADVRAADLNNDGRLDLAIVAGNVLYPALQFDAGTFAAPANLAVPLTAPGFASLSGT